MTLTRACRRSYVEVPCHGGRRRRKDGDRCRHDHAGTPRKLDYHEAWELAREEWAFLGGRG